MHYARWRLVSGLAADETTEQARAATGKRLLAASTLMAAGTLVSRLLGLVRNMLAGFVLGTNTAQGDIFALALSIPTMLYFVFAGGTLNTVLVPQIVRAIQNDEDNGEAYVNRIITAFGAATFAFTLLVTLAARPITWLLTDGKWHSPEKAPLFENMVQLTQLMMPQVFFWGVFFMCGQVLNAVEKFGPMMWAPVANNIVQVLLFLMYASVYGTRGDHTQPFSPDQRMLLAGGTTLAVIAQGLMLVWVLYRTGFRFRPRWDLRGTGLGRTLAMAKWVLWTVIITQAAQAIVQRFATSATADGQGAGLVVYQNAFLLWMMPHGLVTVSLVTALIPHISRLANAGDMAGVRHETMRAIRLTTTVMVPVAVAMAILARPIATLLWGYGAAAGGVGAISWTLVAFCLGVPLFTITYAPARVLYALEDSRSVFYLSAMFDVVNIITAFLFVYPFHRPDWVAPGLALSFAISHVPVLPFYFRALSRHIEGLTMGETIRHCVRVSLATLPAGIAAWALCRSVMAATSSRWALAAAFVGSATIGLVLFYFAAKLLRITEVTDVVAMLGGRLRGRRTSAAIADANAQNAAEPQRENPGALDTAVAAAAMDDDVDATRTLPAVDPGTTRAHHDDPDGHDATRGGGAWAAHTASRTTASMSAGEGGSDTARAGDGGSEHGGCDDDATGADDEDPDGAASNIHAGQVLGGRYRLDEHLITRQSIQTWRGFDTVLSRAVLVHALPPGDERTSELMAAARRAAVATDSRFLRVLDAVLSTEETVGSWVVAEFVPGSSLEVLLADGPLSALEAGWIVRELADALTTMHAQGLYHTRLDPDTVVVSHSGNVKIVGFLTEAVLHPQPGDDDLTEPDREARDVEALGKLLYAMLVGAWPGGAAYGLPAAPVVDGAWPTPRQVRGGVSPALDTICDQILSRPPREGERPLRSAHEVFNALARVLGSVDGAHDLERRMRRPVLPGQPGTGPAMMDSALTRPSGGSGSTAPSAGSATEQTIVVTHDVHAFVTPSEPEPLDAPVPLVDVDPLAGSHATPQARRTDRTLPLLLLIIGALVVSLVLGLAGMYARDREGSPTHATSTGTAGAPALTPLPIVGIRDFDPEGSRSEVPAELRYAIDGDPATAWHTETYAGPRPASLAGVTKSGVGIIVDLGTVQPVRGVRLTMVGEPTTLEVRVPADVTLAAPPLDGIGSWQRIAGDEVGASAELVAPAAVEARWVLVYLQQLPAVASGHQGGVAEVTVLG